MAEALLFGPFSPPATASAGPARAPLRPRSTLAPLPPPGACAPSPPTA